MPEIILVANTLVTAPEHETQKEMIPLVKIVGK